jgi:alpha-D-ribose 1-methylphosphonate 5-triphosphate synthase subunit PhnH
VTEKDCSKTLSTTAASVGVRTVLDFHEKRETVPQFETANFARVYGAHVLEELRHLGFQLEVPERRRVRRRVH